MAFEALGLAPKIHRVDALHLDVEQAFDGGLDQRLRRVLADAERHLIVLGSAGRLLGDDRGEDHAAELILLAARRGPLRLPRVAPFRRAPTCWTASRVSTSTSRRRMS